MDRHLLPEEIDQLLDGEVGFGTAPLKAHLRTCPDCQAELETARTVVRELEHLPHLVPAPGFADRVMAEVPLFVPWHVALLDSLRALAPRSRTGRALAWTGLGATTAVLGVISLWILTRLDTVIFVLDMGLSRLRGITFGALDTLVATLFGDGALRVLRTTGTPGVLVALTVLLLSAAFATRALRAMVAAARRR